MEEVGEVFGRAIKYFLMTLLRHLTPAQQHVLYIIGFFVLLIEGLYELLKMKFKRTRISTTKQSPFPPPPSVQATSPCYLPSAAATDSRRATPPSAPLHPWFTETASRLGKLIKRLNASASVRPRFPKPLKFALILPISLLLLASTGGWSHNFYVLMRWLVCGSLVITLTKLNPLRNKFWLIAIGMIALLFNPVAPFRFDKETWSFYNLIAAFAIGGFFLLIRSVDSALQPTSLSDAPPK